MKKKLMSALLIVLVMSVASAVMFLMAWASIGWR